MSPQSARFGGGGSDPHRMHGYLGPRKSSPPKRHLDMFRCFAVLAVMANRQTNTERIGATENARPENAGLENDGQHFSKL